MPGTRLKCTSPECDYETPNAPEFGQALSLLQLFYLTKFKQHKKMLCMAGLISKKKT